MGNSKKQNLLDAALTLFVAQGISETSTASIAKHAGVATGTLFHHFENKKVLVEALYLNLKQELVTSLQLNNAINSNEQALSVWRSAIKWGLDNPEKFSFFTIYYSFPLFYILLNASIKISSPFKALYSIFFSLYSHFLILYTKSDRPS